MFSKPQTPDCSSVLEAFGDYILANQEEITRHWVVAVDRSTEIESSEDLTYNQLLDHLPQLCAELAGVLKSPNSGRIRRETARDASAHGRKRWEQGYELAELIREVCLIRSDVFGHWFDEFGKANRDFGFDQRWEANGIIQRFFDDVIIDSTVQFVEQQQEALSNAEKALTEQIEVAQEALNIKAGFLSNMSHELRTPLTPILFAASALEKEESLSAESREMLQIITRNINIEAGLISDLLEASIALKARDRVKQGEKPSW